MKEIHMAKLGNFNKAIRLLYKIKLDRGKYTTGITHYMCIGLFGIELAAMYNWPFDIKLA